MSVAIAVAFVATACASGGGTGVRITDPEISIEHQVGPAQLNYPEGPFELQYAITITNRWTAPMTLTRVKVTSINVAGAAYSLRRDFYYVRATIAPGETRTSLFWAKATGYGRGARENEPITLRAIVHFETPAGTYQKVVMAELDPSE